MAYYKPERARREEGPPNSRSTAIIMIDTQNYNCSYEGAIYKSLTDDQKHSPETQHFFNGVGETIPRWQQLLSSCRNRGIEVIWTVIQSLTKDGRDRGLDYKISGFHVPPGSWDAQVLPEISPLDDEIILPKTSSSVFNSTVIDYVLRNLGVTHVIMCGCVTDQCVEHAVRDACDLGYLVTLVTDACVTYSVARHSSSKEAIAGYCRQRTTVQLVEELNKLSS